MKTDKESALRIKISKSRGVSRIIIRRILIAVVIVGVSIVELKAQNTFRVGFYNVENLFDTQNDPSTDDDEYTPASKKEWNSSRLAQKVDSLAKVILQLEVDLLGLCEVENASVLQLLIKHPLLRNKAYNFVHYDSRYHRGVDVALLYSTLSFEVVRSRAYPLYFDFDTSASTRDILYVCGLIHKNKRDTLHLIVNHWPSRRNEETYRLVAAKKVKSIIKEQKLSRSIILIGDFNDEPSDRSIYHILEAKGKLEEIPSSGFYNPFYELKKQGLGTHSFRGEWHLLDQVILSPDFLTNARGWRYQVASASIFSPSWLRNQYGEPFRTYIGDRYAGGFSDHFPVFITLERRGK
ncbi:MAG: endonuclease/exonuclease/phosphatase family protein [Bacteroidia bacterium]|nr:endonuclease/exonuclease/phosphatase family protein [Bacteroidia bacterium]